MHRVFGLTRLLLCLRLSPPRIGMVVITGRDPTMVGGKLCRVEVSGGRGVETNVREFQLEGFSWLFAGDFLSLRKFAKNPVNDVGTIQHPPSMVVYLL